MIHERSAAGGALPGHSSRPWGKAVSFEGLEVEDLGSVVDVEADGATLLVEIEAHVGSDLARVGTRPILELYVE